mmetsp:Transcript_17373/g.41515  ORF Transcript_17373/g.41515 Transcript_17373/m.41515 type:complete len:114 (-) Transcript_17373:720-1061(-)
MAVLTVAPMHQQAWQLLARARDGPPGAALGGASSQAAARATVLLTLLLLRWVHYGHGLPEIRASRAASVLPRPLMCSQLEGQQALRGSSLLGECLMRVLVCLANCSQWELLQS